jgi:hypothetical protein
MVTVQRLEILSLVFSVTVYGIEHISGGADPQIEVGKSRNNPPA